jgi:hypothetical protein
MRTINGTATKYYLQNIFNDYGYDALQTALKAVNALVCNADRTTLKRIGGSVRMGHFIPTLHLPAFLRLLGLF